MKVISGWRKNPRLSVFSMILGVNLLSIVILSCFNYVVFHNNSKKAYLESFMAYNQRVTNMAFRNMDQQIMQTVYNIPKQYFSQTRKNEAVLKPQEEPVVGQAGAIGSLVTELTSIRMGYPFIKSLDIYYENTDTVVTGFSNVHFPREGQVEEYLPWYREFVYQGKDLYFMEEGDRTYPSAEPVLTYVRRISQPRWKGRDVIVALHISTDVFGDFIDEAAGILKVTASDGRVLYESEGYEGQGEEDRTVFSYESDTTRLRYDYSMDNRILYRDVNRKNQVFLWNFLLSVLFNIGLLLAISRYSSSVYRERLLQISEDAGVSLKKEETSFDRSLKQLHEEIVTLHHEANSSKSLQLQGAVRSLILNRKTEDAWQVLKPFLEYPCCQALVIQDADPERWPVEQLQEYVSGQCRGRGCHVMLASMERGELAAVLNFPKGGDEGIRGEVISWLRSCLGNCFIAAGDVCCPEKHGMKEAYESASAIAGYRFIFPEKHFLGPEDVHIGSRKGYGSHLKLFESLKKDIGSENFLELKLHIEMLAVSFKSGNYTMDYCYSTLRDLVALIYQVIQHRGMDMWVLYGYDIREHYKGIPDIDRFQQWMIDICEILLKHIRQKRKSLDEDGDLKTRLTQLIEEHLEQDISLDLLCDRLSMRPDALSRVFKQVMGEGYTDYVKKRKMERAIELMKEDEAVKDIAGRLGYSSPQYFIKVFKEIYGVTPYQYKKGMQSEKE